MRRSLAVRLTLLPMLASAAVVHADPPVQATGPVLDSQPPAFDMTLAPPGMTEEVLTPPGMTPPSDCREDPHWDDREECMTTGVTIRGGVIRGGFGHYFWVGG